MALHDVRQTQGWGGPVPLPPGTQIGDALIIATNAQGSSSIGAGADQITSTITPPVADAGAMWYLGEVKRLDPIEIFVTGVGGSQHGQIITLPGKINSARITTAGAQASTVTVPGLPRRGDGAILCVVGWYGVGGSIWNVPAGYNFLGVASDYHLVGSAWTDDAVVGPVTTGGQLNWISGLLVGIGQAGGDAPPCRMWPRDDDLGVGAGRNYPPPKSQQGSSRGVGYY